MVKVDYHVHTRYSDGDLNLDEVLELAVNERLYEIAITDHDTIKNLKNYKELEYKYNIKIIPGIEIPTNQSKLHILGYDIKKFDLLENKLYELKKYNVEQNIKTINKLAEEGIDISLKKVEEINQEVITYRDIVKYLYYKGYVDNPRDAYAKYIGKGTKAYFPSKEFSIEEVIGLIKQAGGIPVWAHPLTINPNINLKILLNYMKNIGLEGIEICPKNMTNLELLRYENLAKEYKLFKTIGTDFHHSHFDKLGVEIEEEYIEEFHKKLEMRRR